MTSHGLSRAFIRKPKETGHLATAGFLELLTSSHIVSSGIWMAEWNPGIHFLPWEEPGEQADNTSQEGGSLCVQARQRVGSRPHSQNQIWLLKKTMLVSGGKPPAGFKQSGHQVASGWSTTQGPCPEDRLLLLPVAFALPSTTIALALLDNLCRQSQLLGSAFRDF